jgi:hypothetical protein
MNFDIDDAVLQLLKNYLQNGKCVWQVQYVTNLQVCRHQEYQEAQPINYLKTHIVKDLYPCPLATCK